MSNLLVVIAMCADDAPNAEKLLDWVYQLNGREKNGHVLLSFAHDVHQEMRLKTRICADLAFEGVSEFQATNRPLPIPDVKPIELKTKVEFVNNLWNQTARFVAAHYRWPWLYCEPDCVPTNPNWIKTLADAYASQPKKMMGSWMRRKSGDSDELFMARTGIYHLGAHAELSKFIGSPPFEWASGPHVIPRCTKTKLIQQLAYDGDFSKVKPEAVLVHGDKGGRLIEHLRNNKVEAIPEHQNGDEVEVRVFDAGINGFVSQSLRTTGVKPSIVDVPMPVDNTRFDPEPSDKRTKAYREWKSRQEAKV